MAFSVPNEFRITSGLLASTPADGNNGAFLIPLRVRSKRIFVRAIASDGEGWEHVSITYPGGIPSWSMMCAVKAIFWGGEDCVMQLHPPASEYVNNHPGCLHLWRPIEQAVPVPPAWMVGVPDKELLPCA